MVETIRQAFGKQTDLILVLSVIAILAILFTPIPSGLLDFLLVANFSFALLILLLTFYVEKPLEFSTFPSLLLIATLFRLSLNIAATRLILNDADAGEVIGTVGEHVVSGNYVIGMIVFLVLIVVQYVVVTNGAQRVAEVAARFTLDSMPGKQMSIDADMNIGIIDEREAQERRKEIEKEGNFYGAMDGASKFVKGDAIAGIIIILIDILGGLTIGIAQKGMGWGEALQTYTLLTVGDGIVTQIPALIISTGTGIIVTRAASDEYLSKEISSQLTAYPKTLFLIAIGLAALLFMPGLPVFPIIVALMVFGLLSFFSHQGKHDKSEEERESGSETTDDVYGMLTVDPVEIKIGKGLVSLVEEDDSVFMEKIVSFRKQFAKEMGFVIPKVRIKDDKKLELNSYKIFVNDVLVASGEIFLERYLAINPGTVQEKIDGDVIKDPTYGLDSVWIEHEWSEKARAAGYTLVDPSTVLITHVSETIKKHISELVTRSETEVLVNRVREKEPGLVDELVPNVMTLSEIQKIIQNMIKENVTILNLPAILEVLVDEGKTNKDIKVLTEKVRLKLSSNICQSLSKEGELQVLTLEPNIEQKLAQGIMNPNNSLVLEPKYAEQLLIKLSTYVEKMTRANLSPVLVTAPELRTHVRDFTNRVIPQLSILSISEISNIVNIKSFGVVSA